MNTSPVLTPAYGRDYKSRPAVLSDLAAGKDFILNDISSKWDGKPCNLADLLAAGVKRVTIRYKALRSVTPVTLADVRESDVIGAL